MRDHKRRDDQLQKILLINTLRVPMSKEQLIPFPSAILTLSKVKATIMIIFKDPNIYSSSPNHYMDNIVSLKVKY